MKFILFLLITSNCYALAPPPINFQYEEIETPQGTIILKYDGKNMTATIKKVTPLYQQLFIVFGVMCHTSLMIWVASVYFGFVKPLVLFYILTWIGIMIMVVIKRLQRNKLGK